MMIWLKLSFLACTLAFVAVARAQSDSPPLGSTHKGEGERRSLLPRILSRGSGESRLETVPPPADLRSGSPMAETPPAPDESDTAVLESARPLSDKPAGPLRRLTRRFTPDRSPAEKSNDPRDSNQPAQEVSNRPQTPAQSVDTPGGVVIQDGTHSPLNANISRILPPTKGTKPLPPSQAHIEFRRAANRMADALRARNNDAADQEMEFLRSHATDLRGCVSNLPLEKRLKASAISRMYAEGLQLIQDGRASGEESKIRMGFERLDEAHRQMSQLGCEKGE